VTIRVRLSRRLTDEQPPGMCLPISRTDFYREEFLKHRKCLEHHREYYSENAIKDAEAALARILGQLERLTEKADADEVVSRLLQQFDILTNLSAWTDPTQVH
jgi:hypothetical protein